MKFVALTSLALLAATADAQTAGCGRRRTPSNGKHTFTNQKNQREYWLHTPRNYDASKPTPIVILFHGWGYSGKEWVGGGGWGAQDAVPTADKENFIVVAPTGLTDSRFRGNCDNGGGYCSWNGAGSGQSPGPEGMTCNPSSQRQNLCYRDSCSDGCHDICSWTTCNDDSTMAHDLLDLLETQFCIDTSRVYAGGESNGAMMTWQMGTDPRAGRFAALAATIGLPHHGYNFLPAALPLPIIGIWGNNDRTIPPGGDKSLGWGESSDGWLYTTGRQITQDWAHAHGCSTNGEPARYSTSKDGNSGLRCVAFSAGCEYSLKNGTYAALSSPPVVDCRFNGGHIIPAFVPELMWEFFSKHTRQH